MPQIVLPNRRRPIALLLGATLGIGLAVAALIQLIFWVIAKQQYDGVMKQAARLDDSKDYAQEISVLSAYSGSLPAKNYRYQALLQLGEVQYTTHDYADALLAYEQAKLLDYKDDTTLELGIARSATAVGNKATAVVAYKKLIDLAPRDSYLVAQYENAINGLGQQ